MEGLILHRGGQIVSRDDLDLITLPPATDTYQPVSHYELAKTLTTIGQDILKDYALVSENYALARQGNQMFAVLNFKGESKNMALSVGFRNSYDRSMAVGFAVGASVFVCDNLMMTGQIAVMKKHTKNVWKELEDLAIATLYKSQQNFHQLVEDSEALKGRAIADRQAFGLLGLLFGAGILSPRQLPIVRDEWLKPTHPEFQSRNAWSFYNAATHSLKGAAPLSIMERHINLHDTILKEVEYVHA